MSLEGQPEPAKWDPARYEESMAAIRDWVPEVKFGKEELRITWREEGDLVIGLFCYSFKTRSLIYARFEQGHGLCIYKDEKLYFKDGTAVKAVEEATYLGCDMNQETDMTQTQQKQ